MYAKCLKKKKPIASLFYMLISFQVIDWKYSRFYSLFYFFTSYCIALPFNRAWIIEMVFNIEDEFEL